jgi:hypothetical protein
MTMVVKKPAQKMISTKKLEKYLEKVVAIEAEIRKLLDQGAALKATKVSISGSRRLAALGMVIGRGCGDCR